MKLQLLVTHYREPFEVLKPLLDSVAIQRGVDFSEDIGVIIVNDGDDVVLEIPNEVYPFPISYYTTPKGGVSKARNMALAVSSADYVMFCDCDDSLYTVTALRNVLDSVADAPDALVSTFVEESIVEGKVIDLLRENDEVFIHGKVYRRQFLLSSNLMFDEDLTVHEDYYFNKLCREHAKSIKYCSSPFYLWCTRPDSVCRKDADYLQKTYCNLIDVNDRLIERLLDSGKTDVAIQVFVTFVYTTYYDMIKNVWASSPYKESTSERFLTFYIKYQHLYKTCSMQNKRQLLNAVRSRATDEGMLFEPISFVEWLTNLKK